MSSKTRGDPHWPRHGLEIEVWLRIASTSCECPALLASCTQLGTLGWGSPVRKGGKDAAGRGEGGRMPPTGEYLTALPIATANEELEKKREGLKRLRQNKFILTMTYPFPCCSSRPNL